MNTIRPLRTVLPATRNGLRLAGDTTNPDKLEDDLEKYEHTKELTAMCHHGSWQRDCTKMLELLWKKHWGVYDEAGNVIETHEHIGDFKEWW